MRFHSSFLRTEPQRPFKTFAHYLERRYGFLRSGGFFKANPDKYPCLGCEGHGTVYDPEDPPCPIEGNKGRNRIKCGKCTGGRCGTIQEHKEVYRQAIQKYLADKREYKALVGLRRSALRKLTKREIAALVALGL